MTAQILLDSARRPNLFRWFGPIDEKQLRKWLAERELRIPDDLFEFWRDTGGGDVFESESILGPYARTELGDDVSSVNEFHRSKGMPREYLVFHVGLGGLTSTQMPIGNYASLNEEGYVVSRTFRSLADWYGFLREEYAQRYGL